MGVLLFSCAPSQPQIVQNFTQLNQVFDPSISQWKKVLAVWVQVENKDGWQDITSIIVRHPADHTWWQIDPSNWSMQQQGTATWLGTNSLQTADGSPLGLGTWSITIVTKAKKTAEIEFTLPVPLGLEVTEPLPPKPIFLTSPLMRIENFPHQYLVWNYDADGAFLGAIQKTDPVLTPVELAASPEQRQQVRWLVFYSFDKKSGQGLEAGPYPVNFSK